MILRHQEEGNEQTLVELYVRNHLCYSCIEENQKIKSKCGEKEKKMIHSSRQCLWLEGML